MNWAELLNPAVLALLIPIVSILSWTVMGLMEHRERMAMIERGMDPDAVKKAKLLAKQGETPRLEERR